jgi:integrase
MQDYHTSTDSLINDIKKGRLDTYQILSGYVSYLRQNHNLSPMTLKQHVITAKNFLEYYDVEISPRKFRLKVRLPKTVRKEKQALSKNDIINILNSCSDIRLKSYVMLLASTGMRATEALSIRIKDIHFHSIPAYISLRGEFTKTRVDRTVLLTDETAKQLSSWINYKYRSRRVSHYDENGKSITTLRTPIKSEYDLLFAGNQSINPRSIYRSSG